MLALFLGIVAITEHFADPELPRKSKKFRVAVPFLLAMAMCGTIILNVLSYSESQEQKVQLTSIQEKSQEQEIQLKAIRKLSQEQKDQLDAVQKDSQKQKIQLDAVQKESSLIKTINLIQLQTAFYLSRIEEPIRTMFLEIQLKKQYDFSSLQPFGFAFELTDLRKKWTENNGTFPVLQYFVEDTATKSPAQYRITHIHEQPPHTGNQSKQNSLTFVDRLRPKDRIEIPFFDENDIYTALRDFNSTELRVYLPDTLLKKANSISLVVNDWVIHEIRIDDYEWIDRNCGWEPAHWKGKLKFPKRSEEPWLREKKDRLQIDLYRTLPARRIDSRRSLDLIYFHSVDLWMR